MRRFGSGLIAIAALGMLVAVSAVRADEEKLELDKVPKPVLEAMKKKFPDAKLTAAAKEKEGDKVIIEVSFTFKERKYEAELTPEGRFLAIDKEIEAKELPKEVLKALEAKYPKATYKMIEEVTKDDKIAEYEIDLITADKKAVEVVFDPAGKLLKEEVKPEKKEEKLPKEVADALKKKYPDGEIVSFEKGNEDGKVVYEVKLKNKKDSLEIVFTPEGKILLIERSVEVKDVPKVVMDALDKKYPKATKKAAAELTKDDKVTGYEITIVTKDEKTLDVTFDTEGKFVEEEAVTPKKDDKKDK